jgi:hypothetical protein
MINRTFKFYGKAFSNTDPVSVVATFNGQQIYAGTVSTTTGISAAPEFIEICDTLLFESILDIGTTGQVPLTLTVSGGTLFFGHVDSNYSGVGFVVNKTDPDNHVIVVNTAPENFWTQDIFSNSDSKSNVFINNVEWERNIADFPEATGEWIYQIPDLGTFTCDIFVDPALIVTRAPTIEELASRQTSNPE